jgi:signal transduction histidine kinase
MNKGIIMTLPTVCLRCFSKSCEKYPLGDLHFCEYDVAFIKLNENILRKEALVPLRHISENMRHTLNPVLNLIVEELNIIEPNLSFRRIDLVKPVDKMLAATKIIDLFVQMISGVNEFRPSITGVQEDQPRKLSSIINKYYKIYSVLKSARRNPDLRLNALISENIFLPICPDIYEYLISILIDNAWKYSLPGTELRVEIDIKNDTSADLIFINESKPFPSDIDIFEKGQKAIKDSEGLGFGLFWAKILTDYYNRLMHKHSNPLELQHNQVPMSDTVSKQYFVFLNTDISEKRTLL